MNIEKIVDADYINVKRVCKDFEIRHLGEYHELYIKSDTLLLAYIFENFRKWCSKTYELDPAKFFFSFWISMESSFSKDWSKIRVISWYWYTINGWKRN